MFNLNFHEDAHVIELVGTNEHGDYESVITISLEDKDKSGNECYLLNCNKDAFNRIYDKSSKNRLEACIRAVFKERCNTLIDNLMQGSNNTINKFIGIGSIDIISRLCSRVCSKPIGMNTRLINTWFSDWNSEAEIYKTTIKELKDLCDIKPLTSL